VTYRAAAPAGTLGLPVLHTPVPAVVMIALHPAWWNWAVLFLVVRIACAAAVSRQVRFPVPMLPVVVVISAFVESAMWCAAWLSSRVWWSGRWRRIGWRGTMLESAR
jgi:hypothetical protein